MGLTKFRIRKNKTFSVKNLSRFCSRFEFCKKHKISGNYSRFITNCQSVAVKFWLKLIKIQWWAVVFSKNFSKDTYSSVFAFFSAGSESSNLIFLFLGPPRPPGRPPPRAPLRPRFDFRFFNLAKSSSFSFARVFRASSAASPSNASNLTSFAVRISTKYFLIC